LSRLASLRHVLPFIVSPLFAFGACGTGGGASVATGPTANPTNAGADAGIHASATDAATPLDGGLDSDPLVGLWDVSGTDARGAYSGQAEIRHDGTAYTFIRTVHYAGVAVETDRELHWLFTGQLTRTGQALALTSSLKRLDFITQYKGLTRTAADVPIPLTGSFTVGSNGDLAGTFSATGIALTDAWTARKPLPKAPLFTNERKTVPAHPAPSPAMKQQLFTLYAQFQQREELKPYVNKPEFQAAIHGHVLDRTDLDFYRANKNALRVVNKVIDDISLAETRARADSYRWTLHEKADRYQEDIEARFVDPSVGMIPHGGPVGGGYDDQWPSGDSALWTAIYVASQIYRYEVTAEQKALDNVLLSLDSMLKLQEITGDWAHFARTFRKNKNEGGIWHVGTGAFSGYEWMEGGNNDMVKGLYYAYLLGWELFCEGGKTGHEALCARIRDHAKHITDDVDLGGATQGNATNLLPAAWLYAVVTDSPADAITYGAKAQGYWGVHKIPYAATPVYYSNGTVDWSGTHLTSVGDTLFMLLAQHLNLGGDAQAVVRAHIDTSYNNLSMQRFPEWPLLEAAFGSNASTTSPIIHDAVTRLEEAQVPKVEFSIDRRLTPDFCFSPYPSLPWKGDWATGNWMTGLNSYPLFEMHPDVLYWKLANEYLAYGGYDAPGGDYLHLYWFARKHGLLGPTD
jgi:hypothetical protein